MTPSPENVERMIADAVWTAEIDGAPGYTMRMRLSRDEAVRIAKAVLSALTPDMLAALSAIGGGK